MNCNEYIEYVYKHPVINQFIDNIHPKDLRDDLRQEMAMVLLNYDCNRIRQMYDEGNLLRFTIKTLYQMGYLTKGEFFKKYKRNDIYKAIEYFKTTIGNDAKLTGGKIAQKILQDKLMIDANEAHEAMIFEQYVEMRSCVKVAKYFNIPHHHVFNVVKKTKEELKQAIKQKL